jgi:hypothetical protein
MLNKIIKNKTLQTTSIDRSQNINVKIVKEVAQVATSSKIYALTNPTTTTSSASAVHAYTHYDRTNAVGSWIYVGRTDRIWNCGVYGGDCVLGGV